MMSAYKTLADQELAALLKEGDEKAFAEIFERYQTMLYVYAYNKLRNKQEAEDIIQDVLTSLWTKRFEFSLQRSLTSYLFTAVRNRALDLFSHKKIEERYVTSLQTFIEHSGPDTDYLVRENDLKLLIEKQIQSLPPRMREVFLLNRRSNLTHRQIASVLEISELTVSTQIKKAVRLLRVRLGSWLGWICGISLIVQLFPNSHP